VAPRARSHCARPSPAACPPCAWHPLRGPPLVRIPVPPALPACTQKGVRAWGGTQTGGATRVEGTAANGKGGHHPLCLPGMRAKGEGSGWGEARRGEARRNPGDEGGIARAEGRTEGWVRTVPPVPPPAFEQRVGEGAHAAGSA